MAAVLPQALEPLSLSTDACVHAWPSHLQNWAIDALVAFFVVFSAAPALLELLTFVFATRFSFLKY